jgi:DNA-binding NtrC family response regulator
MKRPISTRVLDGPRSRLILENAELRVVAGPDAGASFTLGLDSLVIGSALDCQIVLSDPAVSSRHAEIVCDERGYAVRDLGSKNGVRAGGVLVDRAPLADGLRLTLGSSELAVRRLAGSAEVELGAARRFGPLIAHSVKMRAVASALERLAAADITVLLEGETGTGKEVAAQAIHQASRRAGGPLVVFDCGAQSPGLIASLLFGHERGAFTGAEQAQRGAFAEAEGGTLFLDEIGELPLDLHPVLLRVLDGHAIRAIGGKPRRHDVRIVAATNRNLVEEVKAGRFRKDLYFRLAGARVRLPPLRERREDIAVLAHLFARDAGATLTPELIALLAAYEWPGNVRELRNTIRRAAISSDPTFAAPDAVAAADALAPLPEARRAAADDFERDYVSRVLALAGGNVSRAADLAGVSRQLLTRLIAKHGLRR